MIGPGHHRFATMAGHHCGDLRCVGGNRHAPDPGGLGPAQHMNDHRQPGNIQQWLARQTGSRHAGGNQHQGARLGHQSEVWTALIAGRK